MSRIAAIQERIDATTGETPSHGNFRFLTNAIDDMEYLLARLALAEEVVAAAQRLERTLQDHFRPTSPAVPLACGSCQHRLRALREALANWDT